MFSTVKKKNLFLVSIHFSVYIHVLKLSWQVNILFPTLETTWTIYDLYTGQIIRRKMRLLRTMTFLESVKHFWFTETRIYQAKPHAEKPLHSVRSPPYCAPNPWRLQISLGETYSPRNLSSQPVAGRKGPWGLPTGAACIPGDCVLWDPHMRQSFFITCLYGIVPPLQCVKLKSDKGNAVLEIFISSRDA